MKRHPSFQLFDMRSSPHSCCLRCCCCIALLVLVTTLALKIGNVTCTVNTPIITQPFGYLDDVHRSECVCWNGTEPECRCAGEKLVNIPANLTNNVMRLTVSDAGIEVLKAHSLVLYKSTLIDFALMKVRHLKYLEPGVFRNLTRLRTIYIYQAPALVYIHNGVFDAALPNLKILRIVHTGLKAVPDLSQLYVPLPLMMVDLENNQINKLYTSQIQVKAEQLILNYNAIEEVESKAFDSSQLGKLSLKGNRALTTLHPDSFEGLESLRYLDLSETSITYLPTRGLQELDKLWVQETKTLKVFPSIFNFEYIRQVWLTYSYHCCAFHFPARHHPEEYDRHVVFMKNIEEACKSQLSEEVWNKRKKRSWSTEPYFTGNFTGDFWGALLFPVAPVVQSSTEAIGTFHQKGVTVRPGTHLHALCGNLSKNYRDVKCIPAPDAFNPCEDLMGNWALRVAVWIVAILALFGNLAVLLVLLSSRFRMTVPKFLMCNLALADLCMGVYLLMIAIMDARSIGDYFNHAIDWQNGSGCQVAGFLTVFACELSIFTLTVITLERWYTITYAIHLNKRLKLWTAAKIMGVGWLYSMLMATLPLIGVSSYSKTSICLPLEKIKTSDLSYLATLLGFNGMAFFVICTSYGRMYYSIRGGQDAVAALTRSDMTVAKRMALLVFTDFACWAPIAFFGITALAGYPLIDVPKTKILLVFFYPLNSCANPYLYALLTQQYRRDLFVLLSRYGICSLRAARYKGTGVIQRCNAAQGVKNNMEHRNDNSGPNHRGSLLTTVTSVESTTPSTRPGSLTAVPEFTAQQQLHLQTILARDQQRTMHENNINSNNKTSSFL